LQAVAYTVLLAKQFHILNIHSIYSAVHLIFFFRNQGSPHYFFEVINSKASI